MTFKNALCLARLPDGGPWLPARLGACQRRARHSGAHRTYRREWHEGDRESRVRCDCGEARRAVGMHKPGCPAALASVGQQIGARR